MSKQFKSLARQGAQEPIAPSRGLQLIGHVGISRIVYPAFNDDIETPYFAPQKEPARKLVLAAPKSLPQLCWATWSSGSGGVAGVGVCRSAEPLHQPGLARSVAATNGVIFLPPECHAVRLRSLVSPSTMSHVGKASQLEAATGVGLLPAYSVVQGGAAQQDRHNYFNRSSPSLRSIRSQ